MTSDFTCSIAEAARSVSQRYRDQPLTPLETAVFWTEYVLRHRGAPHLRSASVDLNFVQYHNLDVLTILGGAALLGLAAFYALCGCCWRRWQRRRRAALKRSAEEKRK